MAGLPLAGRHAVIVGAGRGAGPALAEALLQQGARLTLLGHDSERLQALALQLAATGVLLTTRTGDGDASPRSRQAIVRGADAVRWKALPEPSEPAILELMRDIAAQSGLVDILVNNSGTVEPALIEHTGLDAWARMLQANLTLPFLLVKAILPDMRRRGWGRILTVTDVAASRQRHGYVAYRTARQGMAGFADALAAELGGSGIAVNGVQAVLPDDRTAPAPAALRRLQDALVRQAVLLCLPDCDLNGETLSVAPPDTPAP